MGTWSKEKQAAYMVEYREKNAEKRKSYKKMYDITHIKENAIGSRKRLYKLSDEAYNEMLKAQNGCCKICRFKPSEGQRELAVDHNHKTGLIRGLLCMRCNRVIGMANESIGRLEGVIKYLQNNI